VCNCEWGEASSAGWPGGGNVPEVWGAQGGGGTFFSALATQGPTDSCGGFIPRLAWSVGQSIRHAVHMGWWKGREGGGGLPSWAPKRPRVLQTAAEASYAGWPEMRESPRGMRGSRAAP